VPRILVLDRDGVINHDSDDYIKSPDEWLPIAGSPEAIARMCKAGWRTVVASNQSGVARGLFSMSTLAAINQKMCAMIERAGGLIDAIFFCPHAPNAGCDCRKPRPGMLQEVLDRYRVTPGEIIFVGDQMRDLLAARAIGCRFILVLTGRGVECAADPAFPATTEVFADLAAVAETLAP
jgi:D-glycero-D-manno-heptose 1,7-bisphosphate phosphatase